MNAEHAAQLRMIGESAAGFAATHGGTARARQVHEGGAALEAATWKAIAGLGWLGIAVPEANGGLALDAPAAAVVAEEAGRALMTPPLTMGMAAAFLLAKGQGAAEEALQTLMMGAGHVAFAAAAVGTDATVRAPLVPDGDAANQWLVALGEGRDFEVRLLRRGLPGIVCNTRAAVDGSRLADLSIDHAAWSDAPRVLSGSVGQAAWQSGRHLLWLGDAAYLCGLMDAALRLALDYLCLRRQFGVPIGSFQALQHRATACYVDLKATRALVHESARAFGGGREAWAAAASVHRAAAAALRVTKEVVQFHGAIGFADEHDAGLYLRRALTVGARHAEDAFAQLAPTARTG
ncbi:acyl-CoA dehydrogenase family protein [Cupriavidus sp. 2TAF22]|uniref:acyl-CoA dehydrogenase family protein n=1 Tax=unclassified Cupriavidus TaxID=2640874 RepID=UPI003F933CEB